MCRVLASTPPLPTAGFSGPHRHFPSGLPTAPFPPHGPGSAQGWPVGRPLQDSLARANRHRQHPQPAPPGTFCSSSFCLREVGPWLTLACPSCQSQPCALETLQTLLSCRSEHSHRVFLFIINSLKVIALKSFFTKGVQIVPICIYLDGPPPFPNSVYFSLFFYKAKFFLYVFLESKHFSLRGSCKT